MDKNVLVLFSGGLDSTTVLYWAKSNYDHILPVIIDYSQKHNVEVKNAIKISEMNKLEYLLVKLPLKDILNSALLDSDWEIPESMKKAKDSRGVPETYVPFRNGIFLSLVAGIAETRGIRTILTGFNLIDTPDYPDTTAIFTEKMETAINEGTTAFITGEKYKIISPLIKKSKKEIIEFGVNFGADYSYSISCYRGNEYPCMNCPSCEIRNEAFKKVGIKDPLIERLEMEIKNET